MYYRFNHNCIYTPTYTYTPNGVYTSTISHIHAITRIVIHVVVLLFLYIHLQVIPNSSLKVSATKVSPLAETPCSMRLAGWDFVVA
jgi:hypothetical protein